MDQWELLLAPAVALWLLRGVFMDLAVWVWWRLSQLYD